MKHRLDPGARGNAPFARLSAFLLILVFLASTSAAQSLRIPAVFDSHMVLQREKPIIVWGWAEPGDEVTVAIAGNEDTARAEEGGVAAGCWTAELPALTEPGPFEMTIESGDEKIVLTDVLVGEVWLCSGQSNMEWELNETDDGWEEVDRANHPRIRLFNVLRDGSGTPLVNPREYYTWAPCTPGTAWNFSGVAYFYGLQLLRELDCPVGLMAASWGGTRIEPWTPACGFGLVDSMKEERDLVKNANDDYTARLKAMAPAVARWAEIVQETDNGALLPMLPDPPDHALDGRGEYEQPVQPTGLYNAMIAPLVPYRIRGVIWYQGEQNNGEGMLYTEKMKALVGGFRQVFGQGDIPFYYAQVAPFRYESLHVDERFEPGPLDLPQLWEAQTAALEIPNTGMAVTTDICEVFDIHPTNKREVGRRLALWAFAHTYGKEGVIFSGPIYRSMEVDGGGIRIHFDYAAEGLKTRDGEAPDWFQIAGEDRVFHQAEARIDGMTVVVSSSDVSQPVAVRFGFDQEAQPNLVNSADLPASPFRTDDWPIERGWRP